MAKKIGVKNINFTFLPFVKAHLEYFKDGKPILAKMDNGQWDIIYYHEETKTKKEKGKNVTYTDHWFDSTDMETSWSENNIVYWAFLPKEI